MIEKEAKKDKKQRIFTRMRVFLVLFAFFSLIYAYLSFMPTGFSRFARQNADALEKANAVLKSAKKPFLAAPPKAPQREKKDVIQEFKATTNPLQANHQLIVNFWEILFGSQFAGGEMGTFHLLGRDLEMEDLQADFRASHPTVREKVLRVARARASNPFYMRWFALEQFTPKRLSAWRVSLQAALDQLENSLLNASPQTPQFEDLEIRSTDDQNFMMLGRLLVLRAAIRGEGDKAMQLLENYLEQLRITHLRLFPVGKEKLPGLRSLFLALGEIDSFPDEGFVRARLILDRAHLGEKEYAVFRAANSLRETEWMHERLARNHHIHLSGGAWDLFFGGVPAKVLTVSGNAVLGPFLGPLMKRRGDRLALAWAQGDPAEVQAAEKEWKSPLPFQNQEEKRHALLGSFRRSETVWAENSPLLTELNRLEVSNRACGVYFNDEIDLTRLVLAAAHFRHKTGQYPNSLADLTPEYLAPAEQRDSFSNSKENRGNPAQTSSLFAIYKLGAFQVAQSNARIEGKYAPGTESYRKAKNQYFRKYKHDPATPEDLRPFAQSEADMEDFKTRFTSVGEKPVFCLFRLDVSHKNLYDEFMQLELEIVDGSALTEEKREDLERRMNAPPEAMEAKLYWPEEPLISKELMELLK